MTPRRLSPPRRRPPPLGQHFLADAGLRRRILARLDSRPEDCWLEIGAGHGEMTLPLAEASGCVVAIERDPRLAETLRARLSAFPRARMVEADVLGVSLPELARRFGCGRWRVYGNLPYYITSPILQQLFQALEAIADIHVVVQQEVAERLVARPGSRDYGYFSVVTQFHTTPEILLPVPRGAFRPPPKVNSALVRLVLPGKRESLDIAESENFLRFVGASFRQKRKTLLNNLRPLYAAGRIESALEQEGLEARARAEEMTLEVFARLFRILGPPAGAVVRSRSL